MGAESGLDPETAKALGVAGVAATLIASLIGLLSAQLVAWRGRVNAKEVAKIQADAQLEIDRRKRLREHRNERLRSFLDQCNRRYGVWHDMHVAAHTKHAHTPTRPHARARRSRTMLSRYGSSAAEEPVRLARRQLSPGDRL